MKTHALDSFVWFWGWVGFEGKGKGGFPLPTHKTKKANQGRVGEGGLN